MKGTFRLGGLARLSADAAIIGSGAGGSAVADVLTRAGLSVIMIEEGPFVPAESAPGRATKAFPLMWRGAGLTPALGTPPVAYAEGRCVGGGTEINSAIMQRVPDALLDTWARRYGIGDLGAQPLAPYYARVEKLVNASATPTPLGEPSEILGRGAGALGWSAGEVPRAHRVCVGTNQCAFGCPTGAKQSMTSSLLPQAVARGLRLVAQARVRRIVRRGSRAIGLVADATDGEGRRHRLDVEAGRIFVCAGAVQTPALLQRSGYRGAIGDRFRLHPSLRCIALFDYDVNAHESRLPLRAVTQFMPDVRIGGSFFTPGIFAMALAEDWSRRADLMREWRRAASYYTMVRPQGSGSVRALPGFADPLVRFALTDDDWRGIAFGLARLAEAMFAAGARIVVPGITGHPGWRSAAEAKAEEGRVLPRNRTNLMSIHLFGSCAMGGDETGLPVDPQGKLKSADNVWIADGSVLPEAPGVNPQATIMALALRTAEAALAAGK